MKYIGWGGPSPSRQLADRLRGHEIQIDRDDREGLPLVVFTATAAKVPTPRSERGRWLWLSGTPVPGGRASDAVLRGAYDVITLTTRDAIDTLVARLEELLTPEPPLP